MAWEVILGKGPSAWAAVVGSHVAPVFDAPKQGPRAEGSPGWGAGLHTPWQGSASVQEVSPALFCAFLAPK